MSNGVLDNGNHQSKVVQSSNDARSDVSLNYRVDPKQSGIRRYVLAATRTGRLETLGFEYSGYYETELQDGMP